jgi:hypothetical protein
MLVVASAGTLRPVGADMFDLRFLGHAGLKIKHGETTLLTDPWLSGPAYEEQWYPYPLPDRSVPVDDVDYVWYSHGHEDHLHEGTFDLLPKDATVLLTKQWFSGNRQWLLEHGFAEVREMTSGHWTQLGEDLSVVNLVNRSDSLSILRTSHEVIVNVNDALHCYDDACIDFYCQRILSLLKGRRIDYMFCGFAGASYFPNCLRHPHKDDVAVARAREEQFVSGFARIAKNLSPRMAFAFAAGVVLLEPFNHWINEIKLSNDPVEATVRLMPEMRGRVFKLRPGDRIADGEFHPGVGSVPADPVTDYLSIYAAEIAAKQERPQIARELGESVLRVVEGNIRERLKRMNTDKLAFDWAVRLQDCPDAILRLTLADGHLLASRLASEQLSEVKDMVLEVRSRVLLACVSSRWGGEALQIGYGGVFELRSRAAVEQNHTRLYLRLGTKLPRQSDYLRIAPLRGLSHLMHSPYLHRQALRAVRPGARRPTIDSLGRVGVLDTSRWINASPCEGCPVCDVAPNDDLTRESLGSPAS